MLPRIVECKMECNISKFLVTKSAKRNEDASAKVSDAPDPTADRRTGGIPCELHAECGECGCQYTDYARSGPPSTVIGAYSGILGWIAPIQSWPGLGLHGSAGVQYGPSHGFGELGGWPYTAGRRRPRGFGPLRVKEKKSRGFWANRTWVQDMGFSPLPSLTIGIDSFHRFVMGIIKGGPQGAHVTSFSFTRYG